MKHSAGITLLILYTLFQPADAIPLCSLWGFDNLAFNTATSISSSKFNSVMSRTSSQSSLPVSCASSPVTIIDENVLGSHPLPSISRLQVGSSSILGHVTAVLVLVPPHRALWFLRPSFGIQTEPVMPSHPPYLDAAVVTVSWSIDKALDSTLIL